MRHIPKLLLVTVVLFTVTTHAQPPEPPQPRTYLPIVHTADQLLYVRAFYTNDDQFRLLSDYVDLNETEVNLDEKYVLLEINASQVKELEELGFTLQVDSGLTDEARIFASSAAPFSIPRYACYRTVEETFTAAQRIVAQQPNLAEWIDIGDSWQKTQNLGGHDLMLLKLTNRNTPGSKPKFFIMSGLHAREYTTAEMSLRFAEYLVSNYGKDAEVTWMLDTQEFHFLLHSNPDGRKKAESGLAWRKNTNNNFCNNTNTRGIDLNRNFSFLWNTCQGGSCGSNNECSVTYRGPSVSSEPEVQTIQNYLRANFADVRPPPLSSPAPADTPGLMLDIHSFGRLVLWPFANGVKPANNDAYLALGDRLSYFNNYDPRQGSGLYIHDGVSDDFAYGELGVASFTFELGTSFFQDCATFENNIYPGNLKSLLYAAKVVRAPYLLPSGPEAVNVSASPTLVAPGGFVQVIGTVDDGRFKKGLKPAQTIAAARYSIDIPPWQNGAVLLPMSASDGAFNATSESVAASINTTGLSAGRHTVFVQGQDSAGN